MTPSANETAAPPPATNKPKGIRATVIPAIPLPLVQKQQQQRQQRQQKQKQQKQQKPKDDAPPKEAQPKQARKQKPAQDDTPSRPAKAEKTALNDRSEKAEISSSGSASTGQPASPTPSSTPKTSHVETAASPQSPATALTSPRAAKPEHAGTANMSQASASGTASFNNVAASQPPPGPSPTVCRMPELVPHVAALSQGGGPSGLPSRPGPGITLHQPLHHARPNGGSLTFGAFHDAGNTSPPPVSHVGFPPPNPLVGPPFAPFIPPAPSVGDWLGPPRMPLGSEMNGFSQTPNFTASTPVSFHGSQSPEPVGGGAGGHVHNNGPFPIPALAPLRNDGPPLLSPPAPSPYGFPTGGPGMEREVPPREAMARIDASHVHTFQRQMLASFHNSHTSDCHLILHFPQSQAQIFMADQGALGVSISPPGSVLASAQPPVIFLGHRSVLSQSYMVSQLLQNSPPQFGYPVHVLPIRFDDPYISAEAATQALRSLYGFGIEDITTFTASNSRAEAMDKALANAAAGFLLMLQEVEKAGIKQASELIGWETIEKVLAFCLNDALISDTAPADVDKFGLEHPQVEFRYSRGADQSIRQLLYKALEFVIRRFPAKFVFYKNGAPATPVVAPLSRFPQALAKCVDMESILADVPVNTAGQFDSSRPINAEAKAPASGSVSLPSRTAEARSARSSHSNIVFGDFSPSRGVGTQDLGGLVVPGTKEESALVSRLLVNLPIGYFNYILEHPDLGCYTGPSLISFKARQDIVSAAVAERERCRRQALRAVQTGSFSGDREAILAHVNSTAPLPVDFPASSWDVLRWKESSRSDSVGIMRVWERPEHIE